MPYMMGGYPTLAQSLHIGHACVDAGADVIELGVPYSDPLADGPVIHEAATAALAAGANLGGVLELARALAPRVPVVLMCYANMVFAPGAAAFAERLARTGACGLIVPDLPLEESAEVRQACDAARIALVPLLAPTSTPARLAAIGASAAGFLYTVSVVGTTGERVAAADGGSGDAAGDGGSGDAAADAAAGDAGSGDAAGDAAAGDAAGRVGAGRAGDRASDLRELIARAQASTSVPVAIGFGIGTPEQARDVAEQGADGVIVGSRLVRAARDAEHPAEAVGALVGELASALATDV